MEEFKVREGVDRRFNMLHSEAYEENICHGTPGCRLGTMA
jgi:hypothetical protein